jgi:hypothetical protein
MAIGKGVAVIGQFLCFCNLCCTKCTIFAVFAIFPPKWQADLRERTAELTFYVADAAEPSASAADVREDVATEKMGIRFYHIEKQRTQSNTEWV